VEGPGHIPINQIETNIRLQKALCHKAPFYVLGPLVTDIGAGYDHISSAIGASWAGYFGADFLCYVTPAEHLKLPSEEEVKEGVIALKISAHSADLARGNKLAWMREKEMALARRQLDWDRQARLTFNPEKAKKMLGHKLHKDDPCSMCGELCAIKTSDRCKI
ncbi:MAG: phosphomethylpyrimidine synthase ThiC, partial [Proteobacteria bacterium]|nr:phosphomethylpyrimidine synthase ThiC [Pseudomonadota bacterium]